MAEPQSWLQIAIEVEPELAEAVAEALARYLPDGVALESTAIEANDEDEGRAIGPLRVVGYIPVDEKLEQTRLHIQQALRYLALIQPLPEPTFTPIQQANWMEAWKQHYQPIEVGERLLILPAWLEDAPGQRLPVRIDPGMAFGTGTHPTTRLSLELLEAHLQPSQPVLDVGCGSGILSVAAVKLGAAAAYGVDIETEAIDNANQNAALNGVADGTAFAPGSISEIKAGVFPITQSPVVIANILTHILIQLLDDDLGQLVAPGGVLLLSGVLLEKEAELTEALNRHGFAISERRQLDDWLGFAAKRD